MPQNKLFEKDVSVVDAKDCNKLYKNYNAQENICGQSHNDDNCQVLQFAEST